MKKGRRENSPKLTGCTERVTRDELPHASKQLSKTTVEEGHAYYDIWNSNVTGMYVVKGEYEGRRRESEQSTAWSISIRVQGRYHPNG
jgi:hypothetical protein